MNQYSKERFLKIHFEDLWRQRFAIVACTDLKGWAISESNGKRYDYVDFYVHEYQYLKRDSEKHGEFDIQLWHHGTDSGSLIVKKWEDEQVIRTDTHFMHVTFGKYTFMDIDRYKSQELVEYVPALIRTCKEVYESLDRQKKSERFDHHEFYF